MFKVWKKEKTELYIFLSLYYYYSQPSKRPLPRTGIYFQPLMMHFLLCCILTIRSDGLWQAGFTAEDPADPDIKWWLPLPLHLHYPLWLQPCCSAKHFAAHRRNIMSVKRYSHVLKLKLRSRNADLCVNVNWISRLPVAEGALFLF